MASRSKGSSVNRMGKRRTGKRRTEEDASTFKLIVFGFFMLAFGVGTGWYFSQPAKPKNKARETGKSKSARGRKAERPRKGDEPQAKHEQKAEPEKKANTAPLKPVEAQAKTKTSTTETVKPVAAKPALPKPELPKPELPKSERPRPEPARSEPSKAQRVAKQPEAKPETKPSLRPESKPEPRPETPKGTSPKPASPQVPSTQRPRLALIIDDLGYGNLDRVRRLCSQPYPFTVGVLPFMEASRESAHMAHAMGKEVLLHLPMEPNGYPGPSRDPGPGAVLKSMGEREIRQAVRKALMEIPGRKGVNNHMGSRITPDGARMHWILQEIKAANCFFVDSRTEKDSKAHQIAQLLSVPTLQRHVFLDDDRSWPEMQKQWKRALGIAKREGQVVVIGHIVPESIAALEKLMPQSAHQVRYVKASELVQ